MTPGTTLDQAPPDWQSYAAVMADYSADCNRWRQAQTRQEGRHRTERLTVAGYTEEELLEFTRWLEA